MALTPPTVEDLGTFRQEAFASEEEAWAGSVLTQATDALWLFTGMEEYPSDARENRIAKYAIMDLTLWLMAQAEHREEINSPFSSERIGSYSYSKMQQARSGLETGIYWLDLLFTLLNRSGADQGLSWVSAERVFNPEGYTHQEERLLERSQDLFMDPSEPWGF